jgi:hypothetical protein
MVLVGYFYGGELYRRTRTDAYSVSPRGMYTSTLRGIRGCLSIGGTSVHFDVHLHEEHFFFFLGLWGTDCTFGSYWYTVGVPEFRGASTSDGTS